MKNDSLVVCLRGELEKWEVDAESLAYDIGVVTPGLNPETNFVCKRYKTAIVSYGVSRHPELLQSVKRLLFIISDTIKAEQEDGTFWRSSEATTSDV